MQVENKAAGVGDVDLPVLIDPGEFGVVFEQLANELR
jgi:hypothetical protein